MNTLYRFCLALCLLIGSAHALPYEPYVPAAPRAAGDEAVNILLGQAARTEDSDDNRDGAIDASDAWGPRRGTTLFLVNAGGPDYIDPQGRVWGTDPGYVTTGGSTNAYDFPIAGTAMDGLFETERFDPPGGTDMVYNFIVPPGEYIVRLYFAENFFDGWFQRVFDVALEGETLIENVDTYRAVGKHALHMREARTGVWDGVLTVLFKHKIENPNVCAIEVIQVAETDSERTVVARLNAGGPDFTDPLGRGWAADTQFLTSEGGGTFEVADPILGTTLDTMFQTERWGAGLLSYSIPVDPGRYAVRLHWAEIFEDAQQLRLMTTQVEGRTVLSNLDVYRNVGKFASYSKEYAANVSDGALNIDIAGDVGNPKLSGLEVYLVQTNRLDVLPDLIQWPNTPLNTQSDTKFIALSNPNASPITIERMTFQVLEGSGRDFFVTAGGRTVAGGDGETAHDVGVTLQPGASVQFPIYYKPSREAQNTVNLLFEGDFYAESVIVGGVSGGEGHGHPYLHVVINGPSYVADYDNSGAESVTFNADGSHTHEIGHQLTTFEWRVGGNLVGTGKTLTRTFAVGQQQVELTIYDDNVPPQSLSGTKSFTVASPDSLPGTLALYYPDRGTSPFLMIDNPPANADWGEVRDTLDVPAQGSNIAGTPYTGNALVRLVSRIRFPQTGSWTLAASGGADSRLFFEGAAVEGPVNVTDATRLWDVEARFAVTDLSSLPLRVLATPPGGAQQTIPAEWTFNDQTNILPVINTMPAEGNPLGGNEVIITGLGFNPADQVSVNWGSETLSGGLLRSVGPTEIVFNSPPGAGVISVRVETPAGRSEAEFFTYNDSASLPVNFTNSTLVTLANPIAAEFGPDGRLYVVTLDGYVFAYTFDENYNVTATSQYGAVSGLFNNQALGIGFNPMESNQSNWKVYVGHNKLYANGGYCFTGFSPYSGGVMALVAPNFTNQPVINGLPVSNHDHGINGIVFDNKGDMLFAVGGNTNGGVPGCNLGGLDESPLSAAICFAETSKSNFNGAVKYVFSGTSDESNDQVNGKWVDIAPGVDVKPWGFGLRNPFDLIYTTKGQIYAVDNGPDPGFGAFSTGPNSEAPESDQPDEINLIEEAAYYGHPNRNRGRVDGRQNIYRFWSEETPANDAFRKPIATLPYSTNGILEYRANTFRGAMKGDIVAAVWNTTTFRFKPSADGRSFLSSATLPGNLQCLSLTDGPGGVIIGPDYTGQKIHILKPVDPTATGPTAYDIFPWRAPSAGGTPFVIGGVNFGTNPSNVSVFIGGVQAQVTSVSQKRIKGIIPARTNPPQELLTVTVNVGSTSTFIPQAFRYLGNTVADSGARAFVEVDPGGNIVTSSTYAPNSFKIKNTSTGGQKITKARWDLRTSMFPDNTFDPFAQAGDPTGKPFTIDYNAVGGSITANYLEPHDGGGFDVLEVSFNSFDPNDQLNFSIDIDPTSIKGAPAPGPNDAGSSSGVELSGCTITITFDDGSVLVTQPWRKPGSTTGSKNNAKPNAAPPVTLEIVGVEGNTLTTTEGAVTLRVRGPVGQAVNLLYCDAYMYLGGVPNGGFDVDPFEANTATVVREDGATIGAEGYADFVVALSNPDFNKYHYFVATAREGDGDNGPVTPLVAIKRN